MTLIYKGKENGTLTNKDYIFKEKEISVKIEDFMRTDNFTIGKEL